MPEETYTYVKSISRALGKDRPAGIAAAWKCLRFKLSLHLKASTHLAFGFLVNEKQQLGVKLSFSSLSFLSPSLERTPEKCEKNGRIKKKIHE